MERDWDVDCRMAEGKRMKQRTFFDAEIAADDAAKRGLQPCDPNVHEADKPRLVGQNAAILARLRQGPATNAELAKISLKYTSRISDLRAAGYDVQCRTGQGGVNTYVLK